MTNDFLNKLHKSSMTIFGMTNGHIVYGRFVKLFRDLDDIYWVVDDQENNLEILLKKKDISYIKISKEFTKKLPENEYLNNSERKLFAGNQKNNLVNDELEKNMWTDQEEKESIPDYFLPAYKRNGVQPIEGRCATLNAKYAEAIESARKNHRETDFSSNTNLKFKPKLEKE